MECLGVMYLAAVARKGKWATKICEAKDALGVVEKWKPDFVGFSVMTGNQGEFEEIAKGIPDNVVIVAGGPHPTFFPDDCDWADHIVKGEAENWMAEFVGSAERYADINDIPHPDRSAWPRMKIRDFITTRGCPNSCTYCYNERWANMFPDVQRVRTRSVDDVIAEVNATDPRFAYFQDSCFALSMKWMEEFARKYRAQINVPFHCHLRPEQCSKERVALLSDAGCHSVRIALESANADARKLLGREKMKLCDVSNAVALLKKWDIGVMVQSMIGIPGGKIEDDLETLEFNIAIQPTYAWVSIFQPYPGTKLGDLCVNKGWYKGDYSDITNSFFDTSFLEIDRGYREQLEVLQKMFALCCYAQYMPKKEELRHENFESLVHSIMRKKGDRRLYAGAV